MEATLSNDFLGNLAKLTQSLQEIKGSSVDLSGIDCIPDCIPDGIPEAEVIEYDRKRETERLLNINHDPHGDFKVNVKELAKIEDMVKEYSMLIKKLRDKKEDLKKKTIEHMLKHNIDVAQMSENDKYSLMMVKRKVNPTTKARLPEQLKLYFIQEEKMKVKEAEKRAKDINDWLHNNAEVMMDQSLRRYRKK